MECWDSSHLSTIPDLPYGYIRYITWMHRWVRQPPVTSVGEETTSVVSQGGSEVVKHNNSYHPLHNSQEQLCTVSCHRSAQLQKWAGRKPVLTNKQVR